MLTTATGHRVSVMRLGLIDYLEACESMAKFANERAGQELDQIWLVEHPPVYTQGTACKLDTLLPTGIPVVKSDRGGQITYHGPGQIVMYPLLKLKRYGLGVKALVAALEQSVINTIAEFQVDGSRRDDAPGVYVDDSKIAALGLRIRRGTSYHGLSLNVDMDLQPFQNIDPCGYEGLNVTQLVDCGQGDIQIEDVREKLLRQFVALI